MMMKGDKTTTSIGGSRESSEENDSTRFPTGLTDNLETHSWILGFYCYKHSAPGRSPRSRQS